MTEVVETVNETVVKVNGPDIWIALRDALLTPNGIDEPVGQAGDSDYRRLRVKDSNGNVIFERGFGGSEIEWFILLRDEQFPV